MCARWILLQHRRLSTDTIQKAVTTLICDTTMKRDFSVPVAKRASNFLGPISGHHVAQILADDFTMLHAPPVLD